MNTEALHVRDSKLFGALRYQPQLLTAYNTIMITQIHHEPGKLEHNATKHSTLLVPHSLIDITVEFFSHIVAPISYLQCTATGRWFIPLHRLRKNAAIVADDEEKSTSEGLDPDGGPLCREADIALWVPTTSTDEIRDG